MTSRLPSSLAVCLIFAGCTATSDTSWVDAGSSDSAPGEGGSADASGMDGGSVDATHDAVLVDQGAPDVAAEAAPTMLDLSQVTLFDNPSNLAAWPVTTMITEVYFQYMGMDGVHVQFSKQDGPGSWPDVTPPGWNGPLEYTLGMVERINGQWYGSAAIQFWRGLPASGGNVAADIMTMAQCTLFGMGSTCQIAKNWYYDGRWGALAGYQPATGETIGIFVAAGNLRGVTDGSQSPVQERSNVVLMPMPTFAGAHYTF